MFSGTQTVGLLLWLTCIPSIAADDALNVTTSITTVTTTTITTTVTRFRITTATSATTTRTTITRSTTTTNSTTTTSTRTTTTTGTTSSSTYDLIKFNRHAWLRHNKTQCRANLLNQGTFRELVYAQMRCVDLEEQCWGVYDDGCLGKNLFLCSSRKFDWESSENIGIRSSEDLSPAATSCVYELNPTTLTTSLAFTTTTSGPQNRCFYGWQSPRECEEVFSYEGQSYMGCRVDQGRAWCSHTNVYQGSSTGWSRCQPCRYENYSCFTDTECRYKTGAGVDDSSHPEVCDTTYWRCACRGLGRLGSSRALTSSGSCEADVEVKDTLCTASHDVLFNFTSWQSPEIHPDDFLEEKPSNALISMLRYAIAAAFQRDPQFVVITDTRLILLKDSSLDSLDVLYFGIGVSFCAAARITSIDVQSFEDRFREASENFVALNASTTSVFIMRVEPRDPVKIVPPWESWTADQLIAWGSLVLPEGTPTVIDLGEDDSQGWGITVVIILTLLVALVGSLVFIYFSHHWWEIVKEARETSDALAREKEEEEGKHTKFCRVQAFSPSEVEGDFSASCLSVADGDIVEVIRGNVGWMYGFVSAAPEKRGCFPESRITKWIKDPLTLSLNHDRADAESRNSAVLGMTSGPGGPGMPGQRVGLGLPGMPSGLLALPPPPPQSMLPGLMAPPPSGFMPNMAAGFMMPRPPMTQMTPGFVQPPFNPPVQLALMNGQMAAQPPGSWPTPRVASGPAPFSAFPQSSGVPLSAFMQSSGATGNPSPAGTWQTPRVASGPPPMGQPPSAGFSSNPSPAGSWPTPRTPSGPPPAGPPPRNAPPPNQGPPKMLALPPPPPARPS